MKLKINEIFISLDGEVNNWGQGVPTVFIRFQGCNLTCSYCDSRTTWDQDAGLEMEVQEVVDIVRKSKVPKVTITGGEPLLQRAALISLCLSLHHHGIKISVESNGTQEIPQVLWQTPISWVLDYKYPSLHYLNRIPRKLYDLWIKFVIADEQEFLMACRKMKYLREHHPDGEEFNFALSPVHGELSPEELFSYMCNHVQEFPDVMRCVVNVQLHKLIFPQGEKNHVLV